MITDRWDGDSVNGGVQAVTRYLVDALVATGILDIHILSFDYGASNIQTSQVNGYTRHVIPAARLGAFNLYAADQKRVNCCLRAIQPDIVHSQGAGHFGIVALRSHYPTLMTIHGIMSEEAKYITNWRLKFRRSFVAVISEYFCIRRATNTVLISPYVEKYYGARLAGRHFQIPNPVAPAFFNLTRDEDHGRILYAGRLYALKGVLDLVKAVAPISRLHSIRLVLAGALHDPKYVKFLESEVRKLGMQGIVEFRGILPQRALEEELRRSSVLVLPSYQETAPMVIQEAMASGLPVIATNVGGVRYQVVDGVTGYLIEPGDIDSLTSRIDHILSNYDIQASMGLEARKRANSEYRAAAIAEKTIEVYKQILSKQRS
jgi:glycosyltransferase involved in cell wall biosynthesis